MGYNIAMACDFFYPQLGGVEFHIYHLAQKLIDLGHSVVVITHAYGDRVGVRYLANGLKVYHVPYLIVYRETAFPNVFGTFPIVRNILIREQIDIVHSHGSASAISLESLLHANTMGLKTCFTDHSLWGFGYLNAIWINKLLTFSLTNTDRIICVSHTCKDNMIVRTKTDPDRMSVIPNAVVSKDFAPSTRSLQSKDDTITVVVISRLFANKGTDILTRLIPRICSLHVNVNFIVAGNGPKFIDLQQMIENSRLEERVELLGPVPHEKVKDVMCRGQIYLHTSLTEAFGSVLVEAASCGLLIVTTSVGGIPEVLPEYMTVFAHETSVYSLVDATTRGIQLVRDGKIDCTKFHNEVAQMYDWLDVAKRTVAVYDSIGDHHDKNWLHMALRSYARDGSWARHLFLLCFIVEYLICIVLDTLYPRHKVEVAPKWPTKQR